MTFDDFTDEEIESAILALDIHRQNLIRRAGRDGESKSRNLAHADSALRASDKLKQVQRARLEQAS